MNSNSFSDLRCDSKWLGLIGLLLVALVFFSTPAHAQSNRLEVSASLGTRGVSTDARNLFGESVSQFERSLDIVFGEVAYRKNENVKLWVRYANEFNPDTYVFTGLARPQTAFYIGSEVKADSYSGSIQYGYQSLRDSLYRDILWTSHRYRLRGGVTPTLSTWMGVGNNDDFEWMVRSGVIIPIGRNIGFEPMIFLAHNAVEKAPSKFLGLHTHISVLGKGWVSIGASRQVDHGEQRAGTAFQFIGTIPFLHRHHIKLSVQRNSVESIHSTLFALGMTLSLL